MRPRAGIVRKIPFTVDEYEARCGQDPMLIGLNPAVELARELAYEWAVRNIASEATGIRCTAVRVIVSREKQVVTILRAVHKYKDSREQFEQRTHKRLIDIITPTQKTVDALQRLEMPAGVAIDIKMKAR